MNVDDRDVIRFLKYFTFLTKEQISELDQSFSEEPWKREAQRTLARELTTLVHGPEAMNSAEQISYALFYGKVAELDPDQLLQALGDVPTYDLNGVDSIAVTKLESSPPLQKVPSGTSLIILIFTESCNKKDNSSNDSSNPIPVFISSGYGDQYCLLVIFSIVIVIE